MADRVTQLPVEVVTAPTPKARVTQLPVEVVIVITIHARVTQIPVEVIVATATTTQQQPIIFTIT